MYMHVVNVLTNITCAASKNNTIGVGIGDYFHEAIYYYYAAILKILCCYS